MPAIHKLFSACAALLLSFGAAGHQVETIVLAMPDTTEASMYSDDTNRTVSMVTPERTDSILRHREVNPDVIGWLVIPGTAIDRVVLQNPHSLRDNSFYLTRDINRRADRDGEFCTDFRVKTGYGRRDELSFNTTVYGHSWTDNPNGPILEQLKRFRDPEFARNTPYIFYSTGHETMAWEVFAVFDANIKLPYITPDPYMYEFYNTLDIIYDLSIYSYDSAIGPEDKILTLSTCTYSILGNDNLPDLNDYRFVVMAKLVPAESPLKTEAVFAVNSSPVSPDEIEGRMAGWGEQ